MVALCFSNGVKAQIAQTRPNQLELARQFLGTWQENAVRDTVGMWEGNLYGEAVLVYVYMKTNNAKIDSYLVLFGYDERDDKIKGCNYFPDSKFVTWVGSFTTEKLLKIDGLDSFNPEIIWWKSEFEFKSPSEVIIKNFNHAGEKMAEYTFIKVR